MILALALPASQYLVAVNRGRVVVAALCLACAVAAAGNHFALSSGAGLQGVAQATLAADLAYFLMILAVSFWGRLTGRERLRYALGLAVSLGPMTLCALAVHHRQATASAGVGSACVGAAVVVCLWACVAVIGWRCGGWRTALRKAPGE